MARPNSAEEGLKIVVFGQPSTAKQKAGRPCQGWEVVK